MLSMKSKLLPSNSGSATTIIPETKTEGASAHGSVGGTRETSVTDGSNWYMEDSQ